MLKTNCRDIVPYVTKDKSEIQELMHPNMGRVKNQSLARAVVLPGEKTESHRHLQTEELYHVVSGVGLMRLGEEIFAICPGDTVLIPPGTVHGLENTGPDKLVVLCCCAPAYSHEDTILEEE